MYSCVLVGEEAGGRIVVTAAGKDPSSAEGVGKRKLFIVLSLVERALVRSFVQVVVAS